MGHLEDWKVDSWRKRKGKQLPVYRDKVKLERVEKKLHSLPKLVNFDEVQNLKMALAKVCEGKAYLIQGGDCAEGFSHFSEENVRSNFSVLLHIATVLSVVSKFPVVRLGRIAGQFAKPRSSDTEEQGGVLLPSYRGDIINDIAFTESAREPDPERMIQAYAQSASTLNFLRAFSQGHHASARSMLEEVLRTVQNQEIDLLGNNDHDFDKLTASGTNAGNDFYTSHEGLHLHYEEALTRKTPEGTYFNSSAHFLWIGDRTRDPDGAHVEYFRGIENPIGIKCGPSMTEDNLSVLINTLNPKNEKGRITLISRMGACGVEDYLPKIIRSVKSEGFNVIWSCDPMHGNTKKTNDGFKTRYFEDIFNEIIAFFHVSSVEGVFPGALHLELTGRGVTECLEAGAEIDLSENYETLCDPRLNDKQSIKLAFKVAEILKSL